jgi:hypothetical protein
MINQLALPANDTALILEHISKIFSADIADAIKNKPDFFASLLKESITQEVIKKNTLKDVFQKFQTGGLFGGLFGRGGLFSYLNQSLFKKSSTGLTAGIPLGKNLNTAQPDPITPSTPPVPVNKESKEKDFLPAEEKKGPIPILFAGFEEGGRVQLIEMFDSLFKNLIKDLLKGLKEDVFPEQQQEASESGLVGTALDYASNLALLGSILRPFRALKNFRASRAARKASKLSLGQGKRGSAARQQLRAQGRGSAAYTQRTGKPPIKPSVPVTPAPTAGTPPAGTTAARTAAKVGPRGIGSALKSGGRAIPGLGTALTAGFLYSDLSSISEQEAKGELTQKEAYKAKGGAWGGALGGLAAGAALGAAGGAAFGGVGAIPGAILGGIGGAILGSMGGEAIGESLAPEEVIEQAEQPIMPAPDVEKPNIEIPQPIDYSTALKDIAGNTGSTSDKITRLTDAIFALAGTMQTKEAKQSTNIFVNGGQTQQTASAAQLTETSVDAIGRIRAQYAV